MTPRQTALQQDVTRLPRLYTVDEVAEALRKRPRAVREMAARGEIGFHRDGKRILFPESEVGRYLNSVYRPPGTSGIR